MTFDRIAAADSHLAVIATTRADGSVQAAVVNAGMVAHPVSKSRWWPSSPTAAPSCPT